MRYLSIALLMTLVYSCSPRLYYLGDGYPPTTNVDTYYSSNDIVSEFKVIGQLAGAKSVNVRWSSNNLEKIRLAMIDEAKKRGAHGILFLYTDSYDNGNGHNVKADLIRYLK